MNKAYLLIAIVILMTNLAFAITSPANLEITHNGTNVTLNWDASPGILYNKIYVCDTPNGVFLLDETGTFPTVTSWTKPEPARNKFYKVTAVNGPAPVLLGAAENYVILAKAGISTIPNSAITGNIGVSPAASTYITNFSLVMDQSNTFSRSTQVNGKVYAANYMNPTPSNLTTAVNNMQTAYVDAAGRATPDFVNLSSGNLSGLTLVPGLYKFSTGVLINSTVTLNGGQDDVWIFQVSGGIIMGPNARVILGGSVQPKNVFWQASGTVSLDIGAHMEGIVLCSTNIALGTNASVHGRLFAQTAVTLSQSTVTQPAP